VGACCKARRCKTALFVLVILAAAGLCFLVPYLFPGAPICTTAYANFGQWLSGLVALIGIPLLFLTLFLQTRSIREERRIRESDETEKSFERYCKSIEAGLAYIKNREGTSEGGAAIVRYGDLVERGTITFNAVTDELTVDALKSVVAALSELLTWIDNPRHLSRFHSFFRVRFMSLIVAFEKMLPTGAKKMTEVQLLKSFGNDNQRYPLILAMYRLWKQEFETWTKLQPQ